MRWLAGLLTLIVGIVSLANAAENLDTYTVRQLPMPLEYRLDGVVEARRQATLSAEVAGQVEAVYFDVDDYVEQGEVVLKIRDREYRARLQQARAALDEAEAGLEQSRLEFKRSQDLRKQKLISESDFDRARASLKAVEARRESARGNLARAEEQLGYTVVKAPYSGVVVQRHAEPGEMTSPGQPIMTGYAAGELRVIVQVPQTLIAGLRQYRAARIEVPDDSDPIEADRITIHPFANPRNHSFPVRLDLPQLERPLYPGMLVKVALTIGERERLLLPRTALVSRSEVNAVYVVDAEGLPSFRQVRPGNHFGEQIEILAGLDDGERVALDPVRAGIEYKRQRAARQ